MKINTQYDDIITFGAKANAIYYSLPAIVIFLLGHFVEVLSPYTWQIIIVYVIGAIAHMTAYGCQAICAQIHSSAEAIINKNIEKEHV